MIERSLVIIKPDGVKRTLTGEILRRFEQTGLKIVAMKMVWADKSFASKHYAAHRDKPFFKDLVAFLSVGPVVAIVIEGVHAVANVRKLVGPTSPSDALPGTIRGDFAHLSMKYASETGQGGQNIIHASATLQEAKDEIKLWFSPKEIHSYKTVHEAHVF
jgi:nucleoside-diphosphate kinase